LPGRGISSRQGWFIPGGIQIVRIQKIWRLICAGSSVCCTCINTGCVCVTSSLLSRDHPFIEWFSDQAAPVVSGAGSQGSTIFFPSRTTWIIEPILNAGQRTLRLRSGSSTATEKRSAGILRGTSSCIRALALG
jgi:hypothetical protein